MIDNQTPHEKHQQPANPVSDKKPYQKPAFRYERVFETQALSCGKIAATTQDCKFNSSAS
jgi:hypothetical protein